MSYPSSRLEKILFKQGYQYIAAIDEVGRGAWAGPLIAVALICDLRFPLAKFKIKDSKLLSKNDRENIFKNLAKKFIWSAGLATNEEIDQFGLTWANHQAVFRAINNLPVVPDYLLLDYLSGFKHQLPYRLIIDGDFRIKSISLASILAKVTRDRLMVKYHRLYPQYFFAKHKGYGTTLHENCLKKYGLSPLHRRSFLPIKKLLKNLLPS